jgi:hypothetical protein
MNNELILKSTGKEYFIISELIKNIKYSDGAYISKNSPLIYKNGDDSIAVYTDNEYGVFIDDKIDSIMKIVDISDVKNETELDISVGIVRLYKMYEFSIILAGGNVYKVKGKFKTKESKPIASKTMEELGFGHIREVYEKIESINLIDPRVFGGNKFSFENYKFTVLNDHMEVDQLKDIKPIVKRFSNTIDHFYTDTMTKISPSDK